MQLGCVRVAERTLRTDPPTAEELLEARAMADEQLDRAAEAIPELASLRPGSRMVGLAGTVATLAMIDAGLVDYEREAVHHRPLSLADCRRWLEVIAAMRAEERRSMPGMVPGREDVIVGGIVVLVATLERLGLDGLLSSESDILDGLVASQRDAS
jgi:exopolyphosphatase/guanosine-5'-triphosphate,3'-diphosphate pyrophosphatase